MKEMMFLNDEKIIEMMSDIKHRIFPRPFERLGMVNNERKKNLVGVEIGVYKAEHALSLLKTLNIKTLYLINPYEHYKEYAEGRNHYGVDQDELQSAEKIAKERLKKFEDKVVTIKEYSQKCLNDVPDNLDFVYIDGNHHYKFVKADIENYFPKVRVGGVIGGHDFYNGYCKEHNDVVRAVSEFAIGRRLELCVELPDWWIVKKDKQN